MSGAAACAIDAIMERIARTPQNAANRPACPRPGPKPFPCPRSVSFQGMTLRVNIVFVPYFVGGINIGVRVLLVC